MVRCLGEEGGKRSDMASRKYLISSNNPERTNPACVHHLTMIRLLRFFV